MIKFSAFFSFSCGRVRMISKSNVWTGAFFLKQRGKKIPFSNKTDKLLADNDDDDDYDADDVSCGHFRHGHKH